MDDPSNVELTQIVTKDIEEGNAGQEFAALSLKGIRVVKAHKGFMLCHFIVDNDLSDENGNWHVGAIATLVDIIGSSVSYTFTSYHQVTVDLSISYYSTAKVQEEVEVEAKVIGKKEKLIAVIVQVRKKENRELVAIGKLWFSSTIRDSQYQLSKL
ncbi:putative acyl-CoA hydrolase [Lupinus albus]|uniref:Acyl-coenzyme A thioesterase 13 n=1 Tax=Lupinus albus TaxID=3870 RepID=A0A6A4QRU1_LUPAL|nr:putative acyl-CoA hydrolase [Lupinus albus]